MYGSSGIRTNVQAGAGRPISRHTERISRQRSEVNLKDDSLLRTVSDRFVAEYEFADYFEQKVLLKRTYLRREWCIAVVVHPTRSEPQGDSRYRFWAPIPELGGRHLRVVTLADKVTILNAFPDRGFKP